MRGPSAIFRRGEPLALMPFTFREVEQIGHEFYPIARCSASRLTSIFIFAFAFVM